MKLAPIGARAVFISCLFILSSCGPKTPPRVAIAESAQSKILESVKNYIRYLQNIGSAKAYAKVKLKMRGHRVGVDEALKIRFPFSFYFETLDDLANTRFQMISNGSTLLWQDFSQKEYWEGELNEKNLRKFLPLASDLEETLGLFVGKIPDLDLQNAKVYEGAKTGLYLIKISRGEIIWDASQKVIVRLAFKAEGASVAFVYEGDHFHPKTLYPTKETDVYVPSLVKLKDLKTKNEIEINYQDLELGVGTLLVPGPFDLNPLPDAKKLDALP